MKGAGTAAVVFCRGSQRLSCLRTIFGVAQHRRFNTASLVLTRPTSIAEGVPAAPGNGHVYRIPRGKVEAWAKRESTISLKKAGKLLGLWRAATFAILEWGLLRCVHSCNGSSSSCGYHIARCTHSPLAEELFAAKNAENRGLILRMLRALTALDPQGSEFCPQSLWLIR